MFKYVRVQIIHPCSARCAWCATHRKNPLFAELSRLGVATEIHRFYAELIAALRPDQVFISGGEPLLSPEIAPLIESIKDHTRVINLFTSYQWSVRQRERMPLDQLPHDKLVLCHTPIYYDPQRWSELTGGFPFETYRDNIRAFISLPSRKRFKFIVNHERFEQELVRFQREIEPDDRCQLALKAINQQGGDGLMVEEMNNSRRLVRERAGMLDQLMDGAGWGRVTRSDSSLARMAPLLVDGDVSRCAYRREPLELRFALDKKARSGRPVLRYRYCPYFPPASGHRFHVGRDDLRQIARNFERGGFRRLCSGCRFLNYCDQPPSAAPPAADSSVATADSRR